MDIKSGKFDKAVNVTLKPSHDDLVEILPDFLPFPPDSNVTNITGILIGRSPGHVEIVASALPPNVIE